MIQLTSIPILYYKMYQTTSGNCWSKRTPLEIGLILLLIVAVPFLIIILTVYLVSILQRYPAYSSLCGDFCKSTKQRVNIESVNPVVFTDLNKKVHTCPERIFEKIKDSENFKFIASVLENVYVDDYEEHRFLCTAAIVSFKWMIASGRCLESYTIFGLEPRNKTFKNFYARAGSELWSSDGVIRKIKTTVTHQKIITAIELLTPFPDVDSIKPVAISKKSAYKNYGIAEMYFWPTNNSAPLTGRQKYKPLQVHAGIILTTNKCTLKSKVLLNAYCFKSVMSKFTCENHVGFILLYKKKLIGVDIDSYCDLNVGMTAFQVYDVSTLLNWLNQTINNVKII